MSLSAAEESAADASRAGKLKTAVIVVHGMGEQRPMETLRGLVAALWTSDEEVSRKRRARTFSKPEEIVGNFELRRITTMRGAPPADKRFDFFEFYWQHLMRENDLGTVVDWTFRLLRRRPGRVPKSLFPIWSALWFIILVFATVWMLQYAKDAFPNARFLPAQPDWLAPVATIVAASLGWMLKSWVGPVLGDAARYFDGAPENVGVRQAIRSAGVDLIEKLHAAGKYDRIIVIGHSLGSVIGLDILYNSFARITKEAWFSADMAPACGTAMKDLESAAEALDAASPQAEEAKRGEYRTRQRAYWRSIVNAGHKSERGRPLWLVSDFITLGSPLAHAQVFLARNETEFESRKKDRETPSCPPIPEKLKPWRLHFFDGSKKLKSPHHAAVFAPTVWTNIYFEYRFPFFGDPIGGPLKSLFGKGVEDWSLPAGRSFRHTKYWSIKHGDAVKKLRAAVNLSESGFPP